MSSVLSIVNVNLATLCLETLCYGAFLVLTVTSIYLLISRHRSAYGRTGGHPRTVYTTPMFVAAMGLFSTVTAHWVTTVVRLYHALVYYKGGTAPVEYLTDLTQVTEVVKTGFLMSSLIIGDSMIIYRLWVIWGRNKTVIMFPLCTLLALTACGVGITYQFTQYKPGEDVFLSVAGRWITSDCVFTLCTNLYCTCMISYRMWIVNKSAFGRTDASVMSALAIFIESAAIYTSWTLFFFATYQAHSNIQFTAVDVWPAMSGISFMLINVRVGLGWAQTSFNSSPPQLDRNSHPLQPLAVNISHVIEQDENDKRSIQKNRNV